MAQKICSDCKFYVPFEGESCGKCTAPVPGWVWGYIAKETAWRIVVADDDFYSIAKYCEAYERANER